MAVLIWKEQLIDQMAFAWDYMFTRRMEGLTDEEYLWAPVAEVWTVHPGDPATVDGGPELDPAPFTTIAWRMYHMADFFTKRWVSHFGDPATDVTDPPVGPTAAEGMATLTAAYERWRDALLAMPEERLASPTGMAEGAFFADYPFAALVLHLNREFIHHAAECNLVRDLYRQRQTLTS